VTRQTRGQWHIALAGMTIYACAGASASLIRQIRNDGYRRKHWAFLCGTPPHNGGMKYGYATASDVILHYMTMREACFFLPDDICAWFNEVQADCERFLIAQALSG
jgi:hypothetical protein